MSSTPGIDTPSITVGRAERVDARAVAGDDPTRLEDR